MKSVIIVSKCIKKTEDNKVYFKFKGFCEGQAIDIVELYNDSKLDISVDREYLMHVNIINHRNGTLTGILRKAKDITDQEIAS